MRWCKYVEMAMVRRGNASGIAMHEEIEMEMEMEMELEMEMEMELEMEMEMEVEVETEMEVEMEMEMEERICLGGQLTIYKQAGTLPATITVLGSGFGRKSVVCCVCYVMLLRHV
ncbi:hypothetical protein M758_12G093000 [Ceratodon purpureus]|nr:hypothetical protein M758_12G093000 [Ceratodon purpureus]